MMRTKYYYTLEDVIVALDFSTLYTGFNNSFNFRDLCQGTFEGGTPDFADDINCNKLWDNYIYPHFRKSVIIISDEELAGEPLKREFADWLFSYCSILQDSLPKYETLITNYEDQEYNLMQDIKTKSTNKFNDTPQNEDDNFAGDNYVSNISTSESATNGSTPAVRLAEIREVWTNLFYEWRDLFKPLFYTMGA